MAQGREQVVKDLNLQLSNFTVLWTKIHNYHWYVKGHNFFALHEKFEELYNKVAIYVDEIAERALALEGHPIGKMSEVLEVSSIDEAEYGISADAMVSQLASDFETIVKELKVAQGNAEEAGDDRSADMFIEITTELEQHIWMLKAFVG
ncbi:Dps family protein [Staphylococcus lutrae]|uniref:DNA starvation/stationary phase protection protein n=1 Tax=Staphylococcus lutrae TaxID=155085 RepID=A0AAC9RTE1_9STAP|nr:Dps family protein [Staphylococcus lutrae]ARJ50784.1 DNA starvation/stationary phase protection protein [Staphylococcus lutrae]PNZ33995.1 DNA starvation/stationary phase protection protein [Staphylococcus lutrae]